jgi:hypothetical protein
MSATNMLERDWPPTSHPEPDLSSNEVFIAEGKTRTRQPPNQTKIKGACNEILVSAGIVILPMIAFSATLLVLVFGNRTSHGIAPFERLRLPSSTDEAGVYYVDISATRLVFIASLSSSLAPVLAGFLLTLWSFPLARQYVSATAGRDMRKLMTPYQLAVLLRFLNGSVFSAVWVWGTYIFSFHGKRQPQPPVLKGTVILAALSMFLAALVLAADTWLHLVTSTVQIVQSVPVQNSADYSLDLSPSCAWTNYSQPFEAVQNCTIGYSTRFSDMKGRRILEVMSNTSDLMTVLPHQDYSYFSRPLSDQLRLRDYTARTYAIKTQCEPYSSKCRLASKSMASTPYYCAEAFQGDATNEGFSLGWEPSWNMQLFNDSAMTGNRTNYRASNPFYFAVMASPWSVADRPQYNDTEIVSAGRYRVAWILYCNASVYDAEYDSVNGSITRFDTALSNETVTLLIKEQIMRQSFDNLPLRHAAQIATALANKISDIVATMEASFSQTFLAIGVSSFQPGPAISVQDRVSRLVARVPKPPLYCLLVANLLFVIPGGCLLLAALISSRGESREVQARLSIEGLVADKFERDRSNTAASSVVDLFEERNGQPGPRVVLSRRKQGGYAYSSL